MKLRLHPVFWTYPPDKSGILARIRRSAPAEMPDLDGIKFNERGAAVGAYDTP
jgi:hypothetical protein